MNGPESWCVMSDLRHLLIEIFDPRKVLFAAALFAAAGLVAGYVTVQEQLDRELALRQGPPPPVLIQNFALGRDVGPADEVRIIGEVDMEAAAAIFRPGATPRRWFLVAPVFPVSAVGSARLAGSAPNETGVLAAQIERRVTGPGHRSTAIGLVIRPIAGPGFVPQEAAALAESVLGDGDYGQLVTLSGTAVTPEDLTLIAHGALSARGITLAQNFLALKPFTGNRTAILSRPVRSDLRDDLFGVALLLVIGAGLLQFWRAYGAFSAEIGRTRRADAETARAGPRDHPEFAPLPSQREISEGGLEYDEDVLPSTSLVTRIAQAARRIAGFRSRPSHPEDGAP